MLLAAAGLVPRSPHRAAVLALAARRGSSRTDKKPPSLGLSVLGRGAFCVSGGLGHFSRANSADIHHTGGRSSMHLEGPIRPIVSRITIHWPSFYNVVTGKTLALPNLIALQHIPLSPAGVIAKRPAPIALPNSCAAYTYGSLRFTPIKERAVIVCLWMYRVILLTRRGDGW